MPIARSRDIKFIYTDDFGQDKVKAQRTYKKVGTDEFLTPVTPLFLARQIDENNDCKVSPTPAQGRHILCCIPNDEVKQNFSEIKAIIPYNPSDSNHKNHANEILSYSSGSITVVSGKYFGESTVLPKA